MIAVLPDAAVRVALLDFDSLPGKREEAEGVVRFRLKKSLETADKAGARFALIVGENEIKSDSFALKNLSTGEQISVPRAELAQRIQSNR